MDDQLKYQKFRELQKERLSHVDYNISDDEFWRSTSEHAPEVRIEMANRSRKSKDGNDTNKKQMRVMSLFAKDGRPLNVNQAKLDFKFDDGDPKELVLDIGIYRCDINLNYYFLKDVVFANCTSLAYCLLRFGFLRQLCVFKPQDIVDERLFTLPNFRNWPLRFIYTMLSRTRHSPSTSGVIHYSYRVLIQTVSDLLFCGIVSVRGLIPFFIVVLMLQ